MRILVLNYEFPPVGGGGGRVAEDICRVLAKRGHSIRVQTSHVKGLPKVEERDGYRIYRSPSLRRRADTCTFWEMGTFLAMNLLPSMRHAVTWKPDVIHVHFAVPTGVLGWLINLATGIPYVLTAHLGDVPGGVPEQTDRIFRIIKPLTVPIWQRAATVTAVSEYIRKLALESYDVPIETIHNGIDLVKCRQSPPYPHDPKRLVFAGRFSPQKNLLFLIDALGHVSDLDWHMDMLGDGPLMEVVTAKIHEGGLTDRIHLHGWVEPDTVERIMSQSDVLLLPSLSEGMPVVGVRALGHGMAILGSDVGGIVDVTENGVNGFLCPVNDTDAFEKALRNVLASDDLVQGMKRESRRLAQRFSLEKITQCYEEILRKAVDSCKR